MMRNNWVLFVGALYVFVAASMWFILRQPHESGEPPKSKRQPVIPEQECICCGDPAGWNWFCPDCVEAKQMAYAESAMLKEDFIAVIARRERALLACKERKERERANVARKQS